MKKIFKSKLSSEKVTKFFDKEGFYIVLFLCVCVVSITAVWVSRQNTKNNTDNNADISLNTEDIINKPEDSLVGIITPDNNFAAIDNLNSNVNTNNPVEIGKAAETNNTQANTNTNTTQNTQPKVTVPAKETTSPLPIVFEDPLKITEEECVLIKDYSPDELVCFGYLNEWRIHSGIDIVAKEGAGVYAVGDGKVTEVKNDNENESGLGWTIVVTHTNGFKSVYSNLNETIDVKVNDEVKVGQQIGKVGNSSIYEKQINNQGKSHLHFEMLKKTNSSYENVDPKQYITMQE